MADVVPDPALATTAAGVLLVLSIMVPVAGVLLAFVLGERYVRQVAFTVMPLGLAMAGGIVLALPRSGGLIVYLLGAWPPPLGVALRADGLSAVMLAIAAIVICAVAVSAATDFRVSATGAQAPFAFWILLLAIWAALNLIFVGGDLLHPLYRPGVADVRGGAAGVPSKAGQKRFRRRCAIFSSHCSVRSSICWARRCSMASTGRSTSCCCRVASKRSPQRSLQWP